MKKVLISVLTLFFILSMITTVNAAMGSINLGSSVDTIIKGKTFTVAVAATADNNITAMQATLSYDTTKLAIEKKTPGEGFADMSGANEIAISSTSSTNLSKSGTLYTITFKVLDTAAEGSTTISVKNAVLALINDQAAQENTAETSDEVVITIKADDTTVGGGNQGTTPDEKPEEKPEEKPTNTNTPSNNSNNNSNGSGSSNSSNKTNKNNKVTTKLPQTGLENSIVFVIVGLAAISIASFISYRRYKNI